MEQLGLEELPSEVFFRALALGDVAHEAGEGDFAVEGKRRDRELDRELPPVAACGHELDPSVEHRALAGLEEAP